MYTVYNLGEFPTFFGVPAAAAPLPVTCLHHSVVDRGIHASCPHFDLGLGLCCLADPTVLPGCYWPLRGTLAKHPVRIHGHSMHHL